MPAKNKEGRIFLLDRAKAAQTGTIWLSLFQEEKLVRDLVSGQDLSNPGGFTIDEGGSVATFNGAQQQNKAIVFPSGFSQGQIIVAARIKATAAQAASPGAAFGIYASAGKQTGIGVGFDASSNVGHAFLDNAASGLRGYSAGALNTYYTVFAQRLSNSNAYGWINGNPATTSQGAAGGSVGTVDELVIGAQHRSAGYLRQFKGNIEWAALIYLPKAGTAGTDGLMSDEFAKYLYESNYPYSLEAKPSRIWVAAAASGSTGTVAVTNANDTSSASGTTTVVGTVARTNANDTSSASGTTTILGTVSVTNAADTSSASGTTTVTGTSATTNANDTSSASGTTTVTGTSATTNANDTSSASGSVGDNVTGTVATTNANDTSAASGTTTVTGTVAKTNANDTSTASGTTTVIGTVASTNANDTATASGVAGAISGTVAYTNRNDICVASGSTPEEGDYAGAGYPIYPAKKKKTKPFPRVADIIDRAMRDLYEEIIDVASPEVQKAAAKIVKPFADGKAKVGEALRSNAIDWIAMEQDSKRVSKLIDIWQDQQQLAMLAEEEEILLMMMMN